MEQALALKEINLQALNISRIDNLDVFTDCVKLNLSMVIHSLTQNKIKVLENLDLLINLKRLIMSHNELTEIGNLLDLKRLEYLDVSFNRLTDLKAAFLPSSLKAVLVDGNPLADPKSTDTYLTDRLPNLQFVDGRLVRQQSPGAFKDDDIEKPISKVDQSFLKARFEESSTSTLVGRQELLQSARNSTKTLISDSFALDFIETPAIDAQEAAEKMRYRFLLEHTFLKTEFESKIKPFEDRHPQSKSQLLDR